MSKCKRDCWSCCEMCETEYTTCMFCDENTYCESCGDTCGECSPSIPMCEACADVWLVGFDCCGERICEICTEDCNGYCRGCGNRLCSRCTERMSECPYCEEWHCDSCSRNYCEYCDIMMCETCLRGTECADCQAAFCEQCYSSEYQVVRCNYCFDSICGTGICKFQCDCLMENEIEKILAKYEEYLKFQLFQNVTRNKYLDIDIIHISSKVDITH
jgi:hypothetical protein